MALALMAPLGAAALIGCACADRTPTGDNGTGPPLHTKFPWYVATRPLNDTLAALATSQGLDPSDYRFGDTFPLPTGGLSAVTVARRGYAVAVQTSKPISVPGMTGDQIVLLSQAGKILGRLRCAINSRYGIVKTEILPKAEADGSRIVVGFVARRYPFSRKPSYWHNWHTITFGGKDWTFRTPETKQDEPDIWNRKGLCRLGISADKLVVAFPKLEMPDLAKAKSLTIGYRRGDTERQIVLSERKRLADVSFDDRNLRPGAILSGTRRGVGRDSRREVGPARPGRHLLDARW